MSVAELNEVTTLDSDLQDAYRAIVVKVADGGQVTAEDKSTLLLAGRSVPQLRADADRLTARRKARQDLDKAIALDGETAAIHAARDQAVKDAASRREEAAAEYKRTVDQARAAFDAAVGEANKSETDAQARLVDHRQTVQSLRMGRAEMLTATALPDIAQRIDALYQRRQAPAGVVSLSRRDIAALEAEAAGLEAEAATVDAQVKAYLAVGRMPQQERIAIISPDAKMNPIHGGGPSAGDPQTRFPLPKWIHYGESITTYPELFLTQTNEAIANRGREMAAELRERVAEIRGKIAAIQEARKQAPAASKMLAEIDAEIRQLQAEQLSPERFALTG
ncbi:MAG: hypothetical protein KJZ87_06065 [Thermoguttaceae bacterium]|nr:hypothetical protein [Thermoguttaceae bacterium]